MAIVISAGDRSSPADAPKLSPIPEPLRYRIERRTESLEPKTSKDHQWRKADKFKDYDRYHREIHNRYIKHRYYRGTIDDLGRH